MLPYLVWVALAAVRVEVSTDGSGCVSEVSDEALERFSNKTNVRMSNQRTASYINMAGMGLDATDLEAFFTLQCRGAIPSLERLVLSSNAIQNEGMEVFTAAALRGSLKKLTHLWLSSADLGDAGVQTLASAIRSGHLPNLKASELKPYTKRATRPLLLLLPLTPCCLPHSRRSCTLTGTLLASSAPWPCSQPLARACCQSLRC